MRPGDLVEFKDGLFGIEAPDNWGIVVGRDTKGGTHYVELFTVEGRRKTKRDNVGGRSVEVDLTGEEGGDVLRSRLDALIDAMQKAEQVPPRELTDREVWEAVDPGTYSTEELTREVFGLPLPTAEHVTRVQEAMDACGDGIGYFRREGPDWRAIPVEDVEAAREAIRAMQRLRNRLVRVETIEPDDPDDEPERVVLPAEDPDLDDRDRETLAVAAEHMRDFVVHDRDRRVVGLGGTDVVALDGFHLHGFCKDLAFDATGQEGTSTSSAFAMFLLVRTDATVEDVYGWITRRWILESPFDEELPDAAVRAADRLDPYTHDPDRRDLRDLDTVTIDPPDAEDFDDAVSLTDDALWVHIADVSHYVHQGSTMDTEAARRGTSVYLPTRVLPMLPPRLADDLCSLRADEDRPAVSVEIPLDGSEPSIHRSTVHVDENLAYDEVETWIEDGVEPYASMWDLARRWLDTRDSLDLATAELAVGLGDAGMEATTKRPTPATRLIEAFMVRANEAVADRLTDADVPVPYRCHPLPERAAAETFNGQAATMGLDVALDLPELEGDGADDDASEQMLDALKEGGKLEMGAGAAQAATDDEDPDDEGPPRKGLAQLDPDERRAWLAPFQQALDAIDALDDERVRDVATGKLLACLGRAYYTVDNVGHFGLGSPRYLHFTSPIRRYPDLLVHRQLKAVLRGEDPPYERDDLEPRAERSTDQAIAAEELEWGLKDVALVFQSLDDDWDDVQPGVVNGVSPGGAFVSLDKGVEARIPARDLVGPVHVDDHDARLVDADGETVLALGQGVAVRLASRDLAEGKIGGRLARAGDPPGGDVE